MAFATKRTEDFTCSLSMAFTEGIRSGPFVRFNGLGKTKRDGREVGREATPGGTFRSAKEEKTLVRLEFVFFGLTCDFGRFW